MDRIERAPRSVRLLTALLLVGTFAAGTVTGAGIYRWVDSSRERRGPPPMPGPLPLAELDLTPAQQEDVRAIFEAHRGELESVLRETYPRVQAINEQIDKEVRQVLTPEQRSRLDDIKARRPPPPPPGPPGPGPGPGMGPWPPPPGGSRGSW